MPDLFRGPMTGRRVLVVDDQPEILLVVERLLDTHFSVVTAASAEEAMRVVQEEHVDGVILDYSLPGLTGFELWERIKAVDPTLSVVFLSGNIDVAMSVQAMRLGAEDVQEKPPSREALRAALERGMQRTLLLRREVVHGTQHSDPYGILDPSPLMERFLARLRLMAPRETPVLLVGERGTGKGGLAELVYQMSNRWNEPFLTIQMGRDADTVEQTLHRIQSGKPHPRATVLLEDVGELTLRMQERLTAMLDGPHRLVLSTTRDLAQDVAQGKLHPGLHWRLASFPLTVPSLRERGEAAIEAIIRRYVQRLRINLGAGPYALSAEAMAWCRALPWPGNFPQLRAVLGEAFANALAAQEIAPTHLQGPLYARGLDRNQVALETDTWSLRSAERRHIVAVLTMVDGNITQAAQLLKISRSTLHRRLTDLEITLP